MARGFRGAAAIAAAVLLCLGFVTFRAAHQSITIDEADSFLLFAWTGGYFDSTSGNHVLYTLLAAASTALFGLSELTCRLPALLGAALYFISFAVIVRALTPRTLPALLCFGFAAISPMLLDYLVAARGYSLACGLLACAIALAMREIARETTPRSAAASAFLVSLCSSLAVAANFSFAVAAASFVLMFLIWLLRRRLMLPWIARVTAAAAIGALPAAVLAGPTAWRLPRSELRFGARSPLEMLRSIADGLFPLTNYDAVFIDTNWGVLWAHIAGPWLLAVLTGLCVWAAFAASPGLHRTALRLMLETAALAAAIHLATHYAAGMLLPLERTALFFPIFLFVAVACAMTAGPRYTRGLATTGATVALLAFTLALRVDYFANWPFNSAVGTAFRLVANRYAGRSISTGCDWHFQGAVSFYVEMYPGALPPCRNLLDGGSGFDVYFLNGPDSPQRVAEEKLRPIYDFPKSDLLVTVRPGLDHHSE